MKELTDTLRRANIKGDDMKETIAALTKQLRWHDPQYVLANMTQWFAGTGEARAEAVASEIWKGRLDALTDLHILVRDHSRWLEFTARAPLEAMTPESLPAADIASWWPRNRVAVMSVRARQLIEQCQVARQEWCFSVTGDQKRDRTMLGTWRGVEMHESYLLDTSQLGADVWFMEGGAMTYGGVSSLRAAYLGEEDNKPLSAWISKEKVGFDMQKVRRVALV